MINRPCIICGFSDRYKSGKCKTCSRERCKKYSSENKEHLKLKNRNYYRNNKDIIKKRVSDWRKNNIDKYQDYNKKYHLCNKEEFNNKSSKYRKDNPEKIKNIIKDWCNRNRDRLNKAKRDWVNRNYRKVKLIKSNNRAMRNSDNNKLSNGIFDRLFINQNGLCVYCKCDLLKVNIHIDHIMPFKLGGKNIDSNVQLLCQRCNNRKWAKHPDDFVKEIEPTTQEEENEREEIKNSDS